MKGILGSIDGQIEAISVDQQSRRRYFQASDFFNTLHGDLLKKVEKIVDEISLVRRSIGKSVERFDAGRICADCGGKCCDKIAEGNFTAFGYFLMIATASEKLREEVEKVMNEAKIEDDCRFKMWNGCMLPVDVRFDVCSHYYCQNNFPDAARTAVELREAFLEEPFWQLQELLKENGFGI
ncbi:hypothetical protein KJ632_03115 [Patescibacteria group bacterium]|nr:hypothetical protein [Patescibacteria group bacterium]